MGAFTCISHIQYIDCKRYLCVLKVKSAKKQELVLDYYQRRFRNYNHDKRNKKERKKEMTCILSPQVFDLEITIFNDYPIAFENGNTDEMYPDIDYPGKDIVIFFLPL